MAHQRGLDRFCDWLREHKSQFRAPVYGPVLAEVTVQEPMHKLIVQQAVPSAPLAESACCACWDDP